MNKARGLVVIPYFGKLPSYFPFWASSAAHVQSLDWLILTDAKVPWPVPPNVKIVPCSFSAVQQRISAIFDFTIKLERPWDLCALKPAYGEIFQDEAKGYEFWGYGDLDVIYGNLDKFLVDDVFNGNDKIFRWGHLSLVRNNEFGRTAYKLNSGRSRLTYRNAFCGQVSCFDERLFNDLIEEHGGRVANFLPFADFHPREFVFHLYASYPDNPVDAYGIQQPENIKNVFVRLKTGLFRKFVDNANGCVASEEFAYVHFFRRNMTVALGAEATREFCIVPNQFVRMPDVLDANFIQKNTKNRIYWEYILPKLTPAKLFDRMRRIYRKNPPIR